MVSSMDLRWANVVSTLGMLAFLVAGFLSLQQAAASMEIIELLTNYVEGIKVD